MQTVITFDSYQHAAMSYRKPSADYIYALLGLSGEVGELHSYLAKSIRDQYAVDADHVAKELGDILWFIAAIAADNDLSLSEIADKNIAKLEGRKARGTIGGSGDER